MYGEFEIRQIPIALTSSRRGVEAFLARHDLRLDNDVDYYAGIFDNEDVMLAGGGLSGNVIKGIAVNHDAQSEGLAAVLISHLISEAHNRGHKSLKVFTKPDTAETFEFLGFHTIASSPHAVLLENDRGLEQYEQTLRALRRDGSAGVIVMNANPLTIGHRHLIEQSARKVDTLYVIPLTADCEFSADERRDMIAQCCATMNNVVVCPSSDYAISPATMPSYFIKNLDDVAPTQMRLDIDIFAKHIAPSLGATVRFVGTEPLDAYTRIYNDTMKQTLPNSGISVEEIDRLAVDGQPVSATQVRQLLSTGSLQKAAPLVPDTTLPHLIGRLAKRALTLELATTPKPGLIDKDNNGAHSDMDYHVMQQSIECLTPYYNRIAQTAMRSDCRPQDIVELGKQAEQTMLQVTDGVNTHRGAIFALGWMSAAAAHCFHNMNAEALSRTIKVMTVSLKPSEQSHGGKVRKKGIATAIDMAQNGYRQLFECWLPTYEQLHDDLHREQKTLLAIMATLDDTNVLHRTDEATAHEVKQRAQELLKSFDMKRLADMDREFIERNISPGGCADMLALTIFTHSILN